MPSRTYKFRGQRTHGRGRKSGRGSGKQGGRGNAGLHKHKYMSTLKYAPDHFGRHGFKTHTRKERKALNIWDLNRNLDDLIKKGFAKESGGVVEIDLGSAGFTKLLGSGTPTRKFRITVSGASGNAVEKVKNSGGDVVTDSSSTAGTVK